MFEREHHRRAAALLEALDPQELEADACCFGGGTAIALSHGEFRESHDVDFLVSEIRGYRRLRERVARRGGLAALVRPGASLRQARELRADQYGIRTLVDVEGVSIKLEIVLEARISFERPGPEDRVCGIATLGRLDLAASKLLANSDRWADDAAQSRDLIDLAMMDLDAGTMRAALAKARGAYGESAERDLARAIHSLGARPGRLLECMAALQMSPAPPRVAAIAPAVLWKKIRRLAPRG